MMRFNKQELVSIADLSSPNFEREGVMLLKERQDGFLRRSEGFSPHWFRLKGNLLFYLRDSEQCSEPMGLIILGDHQVQIQPQDKAGQWPFTLVWKNGANFTLSACTESERILWLQALDAAPINNLKQQILSLKEKLKKIRPIIDIATWRLHRGIKTDMNEIPLCELALSCDNLICDSHGRLPSPMIIIHVRYPTNEEVKYGSTEIADNCSNPCFSKTILFRACDNLTGDTDLKIIVYDVKERVSGTMVPMGVATLTLNTIQEAQRLRVSLTTHEKTTVGFVTINSWSLEPAYIGTSPSHMSDRNSVDIPQKVQCHRRSQSLPPRLGVKLKFPSIGTILKHNFVNSYQVTYRFHSGLGGDITVHEIMAESKLCFQMPIQLIDVFIRREKELLQEILSLGELNGLWSSKQLKLIYTHNTLLKHYLHSKRSLQANFDEKHYKQSSRKDDSSLEFAPVNLHLQRMWVHNDTLNKTGFHDIITVGAFTSHSRKTEKSGGLIRLIKDINSTNGAFYSVSASKVQSEYDNITALRLLSRETNELMDELINKLSERKEDDIIQLLNNLTSKIKSLITLWDPSTIEESMSFITWHRSKVATVDAIQSKAQAKIKKMIEQISLMEAENLDFDVFEASSGCSSIESSPTIEMPSFSAVVPNVNNKNITKESNPVKEPEGADDIIYHDDHFNSDINETSATCLRICKEKSNSRCFSLDLNLRKHSNPRLSFKSSSLKQVSYDNVTKHSDDNKPINETGIGQSKEDALITRIPLKNTDCCDTSSDSVVGGTNIEIATQGVCETVNSIINLTEENDDRNKELMNILQGHMKTINSEIKDMLSKMMASHAALRLRLESPQWTQMNAALQMRRDTCFVQAVTTAATGLTCWLSSVPHNVVLKLLTSGLGPLCGFEGLLSLFSIETAMWGDMVVAVEDLHTVTFTLHSNNQCKNSVPQITGFRGAINVLIPISDSLYRKFESKKHLSFTITAVFFNIGINDKATLAEALGETVPQYQSNNDNYHRLHKYYNKYIKIFPDDIMNVARGSTRTRPLEEVMENLRTAVNKKVPKNIEVLHSAALATRQMNGIRFTSCKSAKDRTGMSATLEQCNILATEYHLAENEFHKALAIIRSEGCRLENTFKNIGVRKYAFTKKQVSDLPVDYRPPAGTYGVQQT